SETTRSAGASSTRATRPTGPWASSFCSTSACRACAPCSRTNSTAVPTAAAITTAMLPAAIKELRRVSGMGSLRGAAALRGELRVQLVCARWSLAHQRVHGGHDEQGHEGRHDQPADHGAAERRVLLA